MDLLMISKLIHVYVVILSSRKVTTALRMLVTKQLCGEIFYLSQERNVYLDYEGASLGTVLETCEIKIKNSSPDEMICIKSVNNSSEPMKTSDYLDMDCIRVLKYYVGLNKYIHYTCHDFNRQPRCDRASETSAVFQSFLIFGSSVHVSLHIYLGKDSPPTTKRYTTDYWSSWSSWSSDSDYNKSSSGLGTGTVVGIVVGVIGVIVICTICIICCKAGAKKSDPPAVQYQAATAGLSYPQQSHGESGTSLLPQGNQGNQQNTSSHSTQPLINTPARSNQYPGYEIHPPVYHSGSPHTPEAGTYPQQTSNTPIVPSAPPPPDDDDIPDFPPPAYPGY